jgi:hypothetical protein
MHAKLRNWRTDRIKKQCTPQRGRDIKITTHKHHSMAFKIFFITIDSDIQKNSWFIKT